MTCNVKTILSIWFYTDNRLRKGSAEYTLNHTTQTHVTDADKIKFKELE